MRARFAEAIPVIKRAWGLAGPYWRSEERWRARVLLGVIVLLTLGLVLLSVLYNNWNRQFFEALQNKDFEAFGPLLLQFSVIAGLYILAAVGRRYWTLMLQMRWRMWMTHRYLDDWLGNEVYYRLEVVDRRTDNPDQRIAEDLRLFTSNTLDLALGLLSSAVTLVSFVTILWVISGAITIFGLEIPGYMVWVAIAYAIAGSLLTHLIGRPLIPLNFQQQRFEADFRFGLVRLRENAEGVALYRGEPVENAALSDRFENIRRNWWQLMHYTKNLTFLTAGYDQLANIFPILVAAPRYFLGEITLGVLTQTADAFGQVQSSLSWFVENYSGLAAWKASVDRLVTFQDAMSTARTEMSRARGIEVVSDGVTALRASNLSLALPDGRVIVPETNLDIAPGQHLLITGPTGSGKSTLFRALAGIWPFGSGKVEVPARARTLFLPQRPYIPIATLRAAVTYPAHAREFDDGAIVEVLRECGLEGFVDRLDDVQNWSMQLSPGEQQRLAIARAILHRPDWLF
ncbi:MAG: ABC transporter ATP-binding protein/permease, partial [Chloroflexi bacterium]|nr:ABC transporter ATP-binding protein/permease [Chloroflexota bacterium]